MIVNNNQKIEQLDSDYPFIAGGRISQGNRVFDARLWYGCRLYPSIRYEGALRFTSVFKVDDLVIRIRLEDSRGNLIGEATNGTADTPLGFQKVFDPEGRGIGVLTGDSRRIHRAVSGMVNADPDSYSPGLTVLPSCCGISRKLLDGTGLDNIYLSTSGVRVYDTDGTVSVNVYGRKPGGLNDYLASLNGLTGDIIITAGHDSDVRVGTSGSEITFMTRAEAAANGA